MAEWNRRAAQDASPFQSEIRENRYVCPPRERALATLAIRARRDDRKIARQAICNHADKAPDARTEDKGERGADSGGHVEVHRASPLCCGATAATLTIRLRSRGPSSSTNMTPCHLPSASWPRRIGMLIEVESITDRICACELASPCREP